MAYSRVEPPTVARLRRGEREAMDRLSPGGRRTRRRFLAYGATGATLALLRACAGTVPHAIAATQAAPASARAETVVTWMTPASVGLERDIALEFVRQFEQQHPGIKIESHFEVAGDYASRLAAAIGGSPAPDVVNLDASVVQEYGLHGMVRDLFGYMQQDGVSPDDFFPFLIEQMTDFRTKSSLWAVPKDSAIYGVYCNLELFDRAGVTSPSMDWTFDEFRETARRLTLDRAGTPATSRGFDRSAVATWGMNWGHAVTDTPLPVSDLWQMVAWGQAGPWFSDDLKQAHIDTAAQIEFVRQIVEMRCIDHTIPQLGHDAAQGDPWRDGVVAMGIAHQSQSYFHKREQRAFRFDVVAPPSGPNGQFTAASCTGWAIPTAAQHPEAAWAFVKFLVSPAQQTRLAQAKRWGSSLKESAQHILPVDANPAGFKPVFYDPMLGQSPIRVRPVIYPPYLARMREIVKDEFGGVFTCGSEAVAEAAKRAQPQIQALLDKAWSM